MHDQSSHKTAPLTPPESTPPPTDDGLESHAADTPPESSSRSERIHSGSSQGQLTVISSRPPGGPANLTPPSMRLDTGALLEGEQLGQFLLQKFIGGGGMGVVFRALDTTLNREVAVKVLSRDQSADEEALRRFRNEAQSAARLNHENIARVHYVGEDRGVHYIVFEFIEGVNLRDRVEQHGPLPLAEAVSYTYQVAQALDHASLRDVIHRDIKPSNVLITPDGKAKLVDMGLARLNQVAHADNDLTASGVTLGTFDYISPEQARDPRSADVRSDMYSLGCSFFYMLTGQPPFPDGTVLQKLLQHQGDTPPDPRTIRPELPVEVTWLLARMLAKNPAQRFQQPSELSAELANLSQKFGLPLAAGSSNPVLPRVDGPLARWRHHLPWMVPLAALFLIVLALDAFWSRGSASNELAGVRIPPPSKAIVTPSPGNASASATPDRTPRPIESEPPVDEAAPWPRRAPKTSEAPTRPTPVPRAKQQDDATEATPSDSPDTVLDRFVNRLSQGLNIEALAARASAAGKTSGELGPPAVDDPPADDGPPAGDEPDRRSEQPAPVPNDNSVATDKNTDDGPAPLPDGVLVVSDSQSGKGYFASLRAACNNAKHGDVIELRFSGRMQEDPITISNMTLTIRAGDGFSPIVAFRPEANPVKFPPAMVSVTGGQLHCEYVHWELDLPRELASDWCLFESRLAERLRFERSTFTIRNASVGRRAYHSSVAFFDVKGPLGGAGMTMPVAAEHSAVAIDLRHCVARGEANFVRDNELQPLRLDWENGLLATSERLLVSTGGSIEPRQLGYMQINLSHVTAVVQSGLALISNSEDAPWQMTVEFDCRDSVLLTQADAPLVEQRGPNTAEEYRSRVQWSGEQQYFDGFTVFWKIATGAMQTVAERMDFEGWKERWAGHARSMSRAPIGWQQLPSDDRPFHTHSPHDYALDDVADNPPIKGASDGQDAGCIAWQLSTLPSEPGAAADGAPSSTRPSPARDGS